MTPRISNRSISGGRHGQYRDCDRTIRTSAEGIFEVVLCMSPDRLAWQYALQWVLMDELRRAGVEVKFANHPPVADDPQGQLLLGIQGLFAEYKRAMITERLRRDKLYRVRQGWLVNPVPPYGYLYLTGGKGVDVVFDVVGGHVFADSFPATKVYGHVVTLDEINFSKKDAGVAKLRNLSLSYELMLTPIHFKMHEARVRQTGMLENAAHWIDAGYIKVVVKNVFSLDEIDLAHQSIESGHSIGKTVVKIV
jgi:hypothetical protein